MSLCGTAWAAPANAVESCLEPHYIEEIHFNKEGNMASRLIRILSAAALSAALSVPTALETAAQSGDISADTPLKSALFVRNRAGKEMKDKTDLFSDMLSARLSEKGFGVMDWKDVVQRFRESNETEDVIYQSVNAVMATSLDTYAVKSGQAFTPPKVVENENLAVGAQGKDGGVAKASLLRVAQMLDADYIITASFGSLSKETKTFVGDGTIYKTNSTADIYTLPLTVKVLDGNSGQSIYGDTLSESDRVIQNAASLDQISRSDMADRLFTKGAARLAENIASKVNRIRNTSVKAVPTVEFTIDCNVPGATVELDGAALGTPPSRFNAAPGIHQLRVTRQYFEPWERSVNIVPNQRIMVSLELSVEGLAKYKDITAFKQEMQLEDMERTARVDIAKEQSKADADVKEKLSSGGEVMLKNSYIRSDGFADQLERVIHGN